MSSGNSTIKLRLTHLKHPCSLLSSHLNCLGEQFIEVSQRILVLDLNLCLIQRYWWEIQAETKITPFSAVSPLVPMQTKNYTERGQNTVLASAWLGLLEDSTGHGFAFSLCYGLNCVTPQFMHSGPNLSVPQNVFGDRGFKEVIKLK